MTNIPDSREERGLVILSCLLNFIDWMDEHDQTRIPFTKEARGQFVLKFLSSHSNGKNYYLQANDIAARLGIPFGRPDNAIEKVAERILGDVLNFDITLPSVQQDVQSIVSIISTELLENG